MPREEWIQLVDNKRNIGADGFATAPTQEITTCWAKRKDATRAEFYAAAAAGLRPEATYEVSCIDYHNQDQLIAEDGTKYRVMRSYKPDRSEKVTLTCERW